MHIGFDVNCAANAQHVVLALAQTLEVQENNERAKHLYARHGFAAYELASDAGRALFWHKKL